MALPPTGDPRRSLSLAIRSTRLLGVLFVLIGVCTPLPTLRRYPNPLDLPWALIGASLIHLVPGLLYLLCSVLLGRRRRPAVIGALGLVAAHCVSVAGSIAGYSALVFGVPDRPPFLLFGLLVMVLAMAALGQLFFHLARSFRAVPAPTEEEDLSVYDDEIGVDEDGMPGRVVTRGQTKDVAEAA